MGLNHTAGLSLPQQVMMSLFPLSEMMGTASGALERLGLTADMLNRGQANIAAGYAVTYVCGYILVLLYGKTARGVFLRVDA